MEKNLRKASINFTQSYLCQAKLDYVGDQALGICVLLIERSQQQWYFDNFPIQFIPLTRPTDTRSSGYVANSLVVPTEALYSNNGGI